VPDRRSYLDGFTVHAVKSVQVLDMTGISDHHIVPGWRFRCGT